MVKYVDVSIDFVLVATVSEKGYASLLPVMAELTESDVLTVVYNYVTGGVVHNDQDKAPENHKILAVYTEERHEGKVKEALQKGVYPGHIRFAQD